MLKINAEILSNFINRVKFDGDVQNTEFILRTKNEGLAVSVTELTKVVCTKALLKAENFMQYEPNLEIPINNSAKLSDFLGRFKGLVEITVEDNTMKFKSKNKMAELKLCGKEYISAGEEMPNLKFDGSFTVDSEILKSGIKDRELVKSREITLGVKNKKFSIITGDEKFDRFKEFVEVDSPDILRTKFGAGVKSVFNSLEGSVEVYLKQNYPLRLVNRSKESIFEFFIAPCTEGD